MDNKTNLRLYAKNIRKNLPLEIISKKAVEYLREDDLYKNSKNIMLFYPTKNEINLLEILQDDKNFYLPRVNGEKLDVCPYKIGDKLEKSDFGIMEPVCLPVSKEVLDLVIVPALMIDSANYRLGYGGGFYDRFISHEMKTLVVLPKELYIDNLPVENFDKKVDKVILI